ncbi:putative feruloyl esterase [Aspergillus foveolatus]|uniref:putative feruloyl esterase n=1 Tax=Aspergillus foveolatus TaxID=210207 RepID=UPI003CCD7328
MTNFSLCSLAGIQTPTVFGAEISLSATWVTNCTSYIPYSFNYNGDKIDLENAKFWNVTVQYTHPGYKDTITVETWLPEPANWNGRLQATGGPRAWAVTNPGDVGWVAVENSGSRAYNDQAIIGKELVNRFYGHQQVLMIAERYPTAYDGIAASAPAQSFTKSTSSLYYPLMMRVWHRVNPLVCELDFLTSEAIAYCDPLDGVVDGLISNMSACNYDPYTAVNKTFICGFLNSTIALSQGAALTADAALLGARTTDGRKLWYGYNPRSVISSTFGAQPGYNSSLTTAVKDEWFNLFVARNISFNTADLSHKEYKDFFNLIISEYGSSWNADNADLHAFKKAGGKLLTYHGMADPSIPTKGTEYLYNESRAFCPDIQDLWRFFESPGLGHCAGGLGGQPTTVLKALQRWVENGIAPDTLPVEYPSLGNGLYRNLCHTLAAISPRLKASVALKRWG